MKSLHYLILSLICIFNISAKEESSFNIEIKEDINLPTNEAKTYSGEKPNEGKTTLIEWLSGNNNIKKIIIQEPYINQGESPLTKKEIISRFTKSIFIKPKGWHYAPYTNGTVFLKDGTTINFSMFLSGIKINNQLFAL